MIGRITTICVILLGLSGLSNPVHGQSRPAGTTYYVSSSLGDDHNDGLSQSTPFATVSKVNGLALQPGDQVLFRCGDVWRADPLLLTRSGSSGQPITFPGSP